MSSELNRRCKRTHAQVCDVTDDFVCIAEQNVDNNKMWAGGHYSRKFALQRNEETGGWTIRDDEDPMFGWVRCMRDEVLPTPPFVKPQAARLVVDGVFEGDTYTALQIFVGLDAKRGACGRSKVRCTRRREISRTVWHGMARRGSARHGMAWHGMASVAMRFVDPIFEFGCTWCAFVVADFANMDLTAPFIVMMISRMTDYALAAFLNTVYQEYPHTPMPFFRSPDFSRQPLVRKLQSFLNAYPELSGAGAGGLAIAVSGEWDEATTKGCQNVLNKVDDNEYFLDAVAAYRS